MQPKIKQDLYKQVFSLPVSGPTVKGRLDLAQKTHNRVRYGQELVTFAQREKWVKENIPDEMVNEYLAKIQREHCLQLRQLHPNKKVLISSFLRTMSPKVLAKMPGTELG